MNIIIGVGIYTVTFIVIHLRKKKLLSQIFLYINKKRVIPEYY